MITFESQTTFQLENQEQIVKWIKHTILTEGCEVGDIGYVFCSDEFLHEINVNYLDHDTLTDIISFDYSVGKRLHGEIYVSIDRVADNAKNFENDFKNELHRVMIHGILHMCGYKDKTPKESNRMRSKEDFYLNALKGYI